MRYHRKIIRIKAEDSPNVRLAVAQRRAGLPITHKTLVPGVLSYEKYLERRAMWDKIRQCIGLDGNFYEGSQTLLFPPDWLNRAEQMARRLVGKQRHAKAIGIDPGEGVEDTSMAAVDEHGLIEMLSQKTPNTSVIPRMAIAFGRRHGVSPDNWVFDRGGGGLQAADNIRDLGEEYEGVRTVAFGETVRLDPRRGLVLVETRRRNLEERYTYINRRAQMYGELSILLDPGEDGECFALPEEYTTLRAELAPVPKLYDREGRLRMLPKHKANPNSKEQTLVEIIGHSPNEADALVLAVHGMLHETATATAGAIG